MPIGRRGRPRPAPTWGPGRRGGSDAKPGAALNTRSRSHRAPPSHLLVLSASSHHLPPLPLVCLICLPFAFLCFSSMEAAAPCQAPAPQGAHIGVHIRVHILGCRTPLGLQPQETSCLRQASRRWESTGASQRGKTWAHGPSSHTGRGAPETACARRNSKN